METKARPTGRPLVTAARWGNLWPGTALYHKDTLTQFGCVVDVASDGVWVADSYKIGASRTSLYARRYARSYMTANFPTK